MSANEEQLALVDSAGIDHVSYLLVLYSLAFLLYLCMSTPTLPSRRRVSNSSAVTMVLVGIFMSSVEPPKQPIAATTANGHVDRRVHDAEEFELEGLISDEEEDENKRQ